MLKTKNCCPAGSYMTNIESSTLRKDPGDSSAESNRSNAWFITSDLETIKHVGLRPSRKIKVFNGKLEARLLKYEMYAGSKRTKFQKD